MFQLYSSLLVVLGIVAGDLTAWTINDLFDFLCYQGVDGGLRVHDTLAAAVDSLEPEIVYPFESEIVAEPNSLLTPAFAFAIFGLALLAGLAFAVCWKFGNYGRKVHDLDEDLETDDFRPDDNLQMDDLEEDDSEDELEQEDSEDDLEEDNSEDDLEQEDSEDYLELEESEDELEEEYSDDDLDQEDSEDYLELEDSEDGLEIDMDEVSRLENRLEHEDLEYSDNNLKMEKCESSRLEDLLEQEEPEEMIKCEDTDEELESEMTEVSRPEESSELDELTGTEDGPETVEKPDSLMAPAFAFAITVLALLAGLAFAVCWNDNSHGNHLQELEEHLESERAEISRLEETSKLDLEKQRLTEELEESRVAADEMERLWKEAKDEIAGLKIQMAEKDLLLRNNAEHEAVMKNEIAKLHHENEEILAEQQHLEDGLKQAVYEGQRMEKLNNELMEELKFLEKKCKEERITASLIREELELKEENWRLRAEILEAELQVMKNWVSELGGQNARLTEVLEEMEMEVTSVKKELGNEKGKAQILTEEVQVLRKWVTELEGENSRLQEEADENCLEITSLKKSLGKEKEQNSFLQDALHYKKEIESLFEAERKRRKELESALIFLKEEIDNRDLQIERFLNEERKLISEKEDLEEKLGIALNHGNELNSLLEEADEKAKKITNELEEEVQKRETQICHLLGQGERLKEELQQLGKECERLTEKCRIQEEHEVREEQRFRECLRRQQEALREQDKYLLMTLLHGTAQRNFHLQHITQDGNDVLDETREMEKEDEGQEEDLSDLLQMRKETQHRNYCEAQRERTNYGRQWEVLTQTLKDLVHGDETNGGPNEHCGVDSEPPDQKEES
ncbi:calponin homology domain-containing protein DDB_G0272472-like [Macrobrachium nipponense]|uniref:calponin homology domain-containing protein DDB_G0272472-like n=1 Tax=Macrobrachium nipponense TaxID=159736 RepID=UPI0030C8CCE0